MKRITHKMKDAMIEKLLLFIHELKMDDLVEASHYYLINNVKQDKKFDKKTREAFYKWIREDSEQTKEAWNAIALRVFKDKNISREFIDSVFTDYLETYIKNLEKSYTPIIKKKTSR